MGLWIDIKRGWLLLVTNRNIRWTMRRFLLWSVRWLQNGLLFRLLLHKVARFIILMSNTSFSMVILKRKFTWHYLLIWSSTLPRMSVSWSAHYMDWNKLLKLGLTNFTPPCFSFLFSKASMSLVSLQDLYGCCSSPCLCWWYYYCCDGFRLDYPFQAASSGLVSYEGSWSTCVLLGVRGSHQSL